MHLFVQNIRNLFGYTIDEVIVENPWRGSDISYALNCALGRLLLMKQSMVLRESGIYNEVYGDLQCVFFQPFDLLEETERKNCEIAKLLLAEPMETHVLNDICQKIKDGLVFVGSTLGVQRKLHVMFSNFILSHIENLCIYSKNHILPSKIITFY